MLHIGTARGRAAFFCIAMLLVSIAAFAPAAGWASDPGADWVAPQMQPDPIEPPVTLIPQGGTSAGGSAKGGATTNSVVTPRKYTIQADSGSWATIRSYANSWFIGSVQTGMTLNAFNPPSPDPGSRLGYVPERNFCGWVINTNVINQNTTGISECDSNWSLTPASFTQMINCDSCNAGYATTLMGYTCYVRNAYPWWTGPDYPPGQPLDFTVCNNAGHQVYWRYVSANGQWVAIIDPSYSLSWFFVPRSALPSNICTATPHASTVWPGATTCSPTQ